MPIARDKGSTAYTTPADILRRAARPQRHSSYIPRARDWRYKTGVYQHEDNYALDAPAQQTVWDQLDEDYQIAVGSRERRLRATRDVDYAGEREDGSVTGTEESGSTPRKARGSASMSTSVSVSPMKRAAVALAKKKRSRAWQVDYFARDACAADEGVPTQQEAEAEEGDEKDEHWTQTRLVLHLQFSDRTTSALQRIVSSLPTPAPSSLSASPVRPRQMRHDSVAPPTPKSTASTSLQSVQLFQRTWADETRSFNMAAVRKKLRDPVAAATFEVPEGCVWFAEAVGMYALFPPGVPVTAKEICAFYPHHVRHDGVARRLLNNGFCGDVLLDMQSPFRTAPPTPTANLLLLPPLPHKPKPTRDLYTDHLLPSNSNSKSKSKPQSKSKSTKSPLSHPGLTLPTFADLLRGVKSLPTGLDARGLTQCLSWYLHNRDLFTPRLDLNVLHMQALLRALRVPLKGFGGRNLDRVGLAEWVERGWSGVEVQGNINDDRDDDGKGEGAGAGAGAGASASASAGAGAHVAVSRIEIDVDNEDVKLNLQLPLRSVLMLPFISIQALVGRALEKGVQRAEAKRVVRRQKEVGIKKQKEAAVDVDVEVEVQATHAHAHVELREQQQNQQNQQRQTQNQPLTLAVALNGYRIPKRARTPVDDEGRVRCAKRVVTKATMAMGTATTNTPPPESHKRASTPRSTAHPTPPSGPRFPRPQSQPQHAPPQYTSRRYGAEKFVYGSASRSQQYPHCPPPPPPPPPPAPAPAPLVDAPSQQTPAYAKHADYNYDYAYDYTRQGYDTRYRYGYSAAQGESFGAGAGDRR
ncbi:hypothetical protein BDV95DRAFT_607888 [Massariosphaeria phaeospora]|uniref:Uncharacterized protein n=1 Tax=Massariosphaeria phaeospora TaxID=100035 RepID=A0A7C8I9L7_9PLEO|nr:hypothetical protein BDV95DRAFT_607888 [Massariosphaeria phaeospora]